MSFIKQGRGKITTVTTDSKKGAIEINNDAKVVRSTKTSITVKSGDEEHSVDASEEEIAELKKKKGRKLAAAILPYLNNGE
jgi:hypothetical protein